ncbi:MAG: hypothetical protein OXI20_22630 [Rhodospirillales bacterium]|nr:hypothetical protein [Rhodospirillales bacterium]
MALSPDSPYARGFAADGDTLQALRTGLADRRAKVQRGRLAAALRSLASEPASRVLFVDLDGVSEPGRAARELASVCAFETAVIAIGSTDTAQYTRELFQHGIADYLVKPISASLVREACASLTDEAAERPYAGRVIAFAGSAGSGTSTLVAALSRAAGVDGRTASVVDLDPVAGRLPGLLGVEPAEGLPAIFAALGSQTAGDCDAGAATDRIEGVGVTTEPGVSLIAYATAPTLPPPPSPDALSRLLAHLANRTHLVLVTGFPDPVLQLEVLQRADTRVLLYEPTLASLSAAVRSLALLGTSHPATLVQSSPRMARSGLSPAHIRYALGDRRPDVAVPFDTALHAAATGGRPKQPGRAWRSAVGKVLEHVLERAAVSQGADGA